MPDHLRVLGLSRAVGEEYLRGRGYECRVTEYSAKREVDNADDWRIVRCAIKNGVADIVVCKFCTNI